MAFIVVFLSILVTLPVLALLRWIMARRIQRLMMRRSKRADTPLEEFQQTEEIAAPVPLDLKTVDRRTIAADTKRARANAIEAARSQFGRWTSYEILASAAYAGFAFLADFLAGPGTIVRSEIVQYMYFLALAYSIAIVLRHLIYVRQYKRVRGLRFFGSFGRVVSAVIWTPLRVLIRPDNWFIPFLICIGVAVSLATWAISESVVLSVAIFAAIATHLSLRVELYLRAQSVEGRKLLILRVFGMDKTAFLTFGHILNYWRHFGPSFTVVDPSYFRFLYRGLSDRNIAIVFWVSLVISLLAAAIIAQEAPTDELMARIAPLASIPITAILVIGGYIFVLLYLFLMAPRSFVANSAQIQARLASVEARPRHLDLTFRDVHMYCYDNTWRIAVAEFVDAADVVLMDLRGFSDDRAGCEYEVDFLFDTVPVNHIVFIADEASDIGAISQLIRERWAELRVTSPNLAVSEPTATIFLSEGEKSDDVRALVDLLFEAADAAWPAGTVASSRSGTAGHGSAGSSEGLSELGALVFEVFAGTIEDVRDFVRDHPAIPLIALMIAGIGYLAFYTTHLEGLILPGGTGPSPDVILQFGDWTLGYKLLVILGVTVVLNGVLMFLAAVVFGDLLTFDDSDMIAIFLGLCVFGGSIAHLVFVADGDLALRLDSLFLLFMEPVAWVMST